MQAVTFNTETPARVEKGLLVFGLRFWASQRVLPSSTSGSVQAVPFDHKKLSGTSSPMGGKLALRKRGFDCALASFPSRLFHPGFKVTSAGWLQ